ncbi:RNA polymerase sigma factor [Emergencia sp.]|uniref:RNA polymerase sigma factor n=1 Tax=Emergencia sp. TaxID=1926557 RepID=UPI003AEF1DDB
MDFEEIYSAYFKDVYRYVCGLSADAVIAEEVTQESFVKALKAVDRFDGRTDVRAWLFSIAKNTYYSHCRKKKESVMEDTVVTDVSLSERLVDKETAFFIHQYLHNMDEPYKEVFYLRVFGELPFKKIGLLFGKSDDWARVTYYRAKKQIMAYMEEMER